MKQLDLFQVVMLLYVRICLVIGKGHVAHQYLIGAKREYKSYIYGKKRVHSVRST